MNQTRVGILGATGYTALELMRILIHHPSVRITALTTRQEDRPHIAAVHPSLSGLLDLHCEPLTTEELTERCELIFCALPHAASMDVIPGLLEAGLKVVDLSADYRLNDPGVYEQWYGHVHTDPTRLASTVYGLPELFADEIRQAQLVANPGCYTSASILALAPLLKEGLIRPEGIIIDAKSGVSGAGRSPKLATLFTECNESISAYGIGTHRHTPEIEEVLSWVAGASVQIAFNPHLTPMNRGILATIYPQTTDPDLSADAATEAIRAAYKDSPFVRVVGELPRTGDVCHTNFCDITVRRNRHQLVVFSAIDNLVKGAAGVAVQNMNLVLGHDERLGMLPCN